MSDTTERVAPTKQIIQIVRNWSDLFGFADEQSEVWLQQATAQAQEDAPDATEPEFALGIEYEDGEGNRYQPITVKEEGRTTNTSVIVRLGYNGRIWSLDERKTEAHSSAHRQQWRGTTAN